MFRFLGCWFERFLSPPNPAEPAPLKSPQFEQAIEYVLKPDNSELTFKSLKRRLPDVEELTPEQLEICLKTYYWTGTGIDQLENPIIATAIFDQAIMTDLKPAVTRAQASLYTLGIKTPITGVMDFDTIDILNKIQPRSFIKAFITQVKAYYQGLISQDCLKEPLYKDWIRRVNHLSKMI